MTTVQRPLLSSKNYYNIPVFDFTIFVANFFAVCDRFVSKRQYSTGLFPMKRGKLSLLQKIEKIPLAQYLIGAHGDGVGQIQASGLLEHR